ncbi:MAG: cytochrome c [Chitinophagales bacterium]|nr:cytochrome c [Chitinophagales bacterium]
MNRQVNYIVSAHLLLATLTAGVLFVKNISSTELLSGKQETVTSTANSTATVLSETAAKGKVLFLSKCASCHSIFKDATGPGLLGFQDRGPWPDRNKLYEWIKNPSEFMKNDPYTRELKKRYGTMMTDFPDITRNEVDAIADFLIQYEAQRRY